MQDPQGIFSWAVSGATHSISAYLHETPLGKKLSLHVEVRSWLNRLDFKQEDFGTWGQDPAALSQMAKLQ